MTAAYERCRQLHARHGRTYYLATLLLPRWKRRHVHALYGFTRHADEVVDDLASTLDRVGRAAALGAWGERFFAGLRCAPSDDPICPRCGTRCGPSTSTQATSPSSLSRWPWT